MNLNDIRLEFKMYNFLSLSSGLEFWKKKGQQGEGVVKMNK